jgi:hypothetical protein
VEEEKRGEKISRGEVEMFYRRLMCCIIYFHVLSVVLTETEMINFSNIIFYRILKYNKFMIRTRVEMQYMQHTHILR